MPLGFERLNERTQRPNTLINFIKPLSGPSQEIALDFLNRIAAICYPVMKANHIAVMALEEFPPNREFVGRNFNNGEVVQLVLKTHGGGWLPFRSVQMVMMHELAHCKEMNHSKAFWRVRDEYAVMLRGLWAKGYHGEGLWGRGKSLIEGREVDVSRGLEESLGVESLCGGTYRSGGRKRRRKTERKNVSYREQKERRILKKFGRNGVALGADEDVKAKLEGAKKTTKPRVAGSARGRELRAAAALARFDPVKKDEDEVKDEDTNSETESESEFEECSGDVAVDVDGQRMFDDRGRGLIKVCEDEHQEDDNFRREMNDLWNTESVSRQSQAPTADSDQSRWERTSSHAKYKSRTKSKPGQQEKVPPQKPSSTSKPTGQNQAKRITIHSTKASQQSSSGSTALPPDGSSRTCPICSLENDQDATTCAVCAHVLDPKKLPNNWKCLSLACRSSGYTNACDCGRCGACGAAKPS